VADHVKELISVLMDGEASEIEIHRLLRQMKEDDAHREVWVTYHETRRVLRAGSQKSGRHLNHRQHLELHQRISAAVAEDNSYSTLSSTKNKTSLSSLYRPAAGLAVAASLVVALFVGFQQQPVEISGEPSQSVQSSPGQSSPSQSSLSESSLITVQPVLNEIAKEEVAPGSELELKELDAEGQKRLRAYLNQHDAMARMRQNTQLVNYPKPRDR